LKGFVLAAGFGERLRPITNVLPKALVPVLNLPSICYALSLLRETQIEDIIVNLHYKGDEIIRFFEAHDYFGCNFTFSEEDAILGTGGGVKKCESLLKDEEFVLINSDIILDIDLKAVIDHHRRSDHPATLVLFETPEAGRIGPVDVREDRVVGFHTPTKKEIECGLIYTGIAVLSPAIFPYMEEGFSSIVTTGYAGLIRDHSLGWYRHEGFWQDIGSMEAFWHANVRMRDRIIGMERRISQYLGMGPEIVSPSAMIKSDAFVRDSIIGERARIGWQARVEESVVMLDAGVENEQRIKRSVVYPGGIIEIDSE
jgi:mannose-1-phosphate guanylyltransferase